MFYAITFPMYEYKSIVNKCIRLSISSISYQIKPVKGQKMGSSKSKFSFIVGLSSEDSMYYYLVYNYVHLL